MKQYIRGNPNILEFKRLGRVGASGILYGIDVYQDNVEKAANSIGVGGYVVLKVCSTGTT